MHIRMHAFVSDLPTGMMLGIMDVWGKPGRVGPFFCAHADKQ